MNQDSGGPLRALLISTRPDHARLLERSLAALDGWDWVRVSHRSEAAALARLGDFAAIVADADGSDWAEAGGAPAAVAQGGTPVLVLGRGPRPEGEAEPQAGSWIDWDHFSRAKLAAALAAAVGGNNPAASEAALDPRTGLVGVRGFLEQAALSCSQALGRRGGVGLLLVGVGGTATEAGPGAREAAQRLRACLRGEHLVGRCADDEIAVLLNGSASPEELVLQGKRILEALRPGAGESRPSVGAALLPGSGTTAEGLLESARRGLARSVALGGDCVHFGDAGLDPGGGDRFRYEVDLRRGLLQGQFTLHWQPQADRSGTLLGAEALLRWIHPDKGPVPPSEFIPASESCGFIEDLSVWAVEQALRASAVQAALVPGFRAGVNLSLRQFQDPAFAELLLDALRRSGCPGSRLCLEVSDQGLVEDPDCVARGLRLLREEGVQVALDDFGQAFASVSTVKRLPLDAVKLHPGLVSDLGNGRDDERIAELVVGMAHQMGLRAVATGVDEPRQWNALRKLGCDAYQGHLLQGPLSSEALEDWLHQRG